MLIFNSKQDAVNSLPRSQQTIIQQLRIDRYPTARRLFLIGKQENDLCQYCQHSCGDIRHYLIECEVLKDSRNFEINDLKLILFGDMELLTNVASFAAKYI
jgi:hypothetical protein